MTQQEYEFKRDNYLAILSTTHNLSQTFYQTAIALAKLYKTYQDGSKS